MQALYAFFQDGKGNVASEEKKLIKSIYEIYDLYIYQLSFLIEIVEFARESIEIAKNKFYPTEEEKNPNTRFVNNSLILMLETNPDYILKRDKLHINWIELKDLFRKIFNTLKEDEKFRKYLMDDNHNSDAECEILVHIVDTYIADDEVLLQYFEEKNLAWMVDFDIAAYMVVKTLKYLKTCKKLVLLPRLFADNKEQVEKDEIKFISDLFCKTIIHQAEYDDIIENKIENWEIDRIAVMDLLLLKMALCEFMEFPTIPTKVTINEYIEISKLYSSPKSKMFINGILDKILIEYTEKKKIVKKGRGLIG